VKSPLLDGVRSIGRPAVAVTDQIRAVTKERFQQKMGDLSAAELTAVEDGLREVLELS
jgi:mRNA-degrading endonuclease toxin of MazEF toxin-antitoxin module